MENYFQMNFTKNQVDAITSVGLAHLGDGVYELLCRSYLCAKGTLTVRKLHQETVALVTAPTQARVAEALLPKLSEEELSYYRRGKNAHTHTAPKAASPKEYAMATGLEALFGALYLYGRQERIQELFALGMEAVYGI